MFGASILGCLRGSFLLDNEAHNRRHLLVGHPDLVKHPESGIRDARAFRQEFFDLAAGAVPIRSGRPTEVFVKLRSLLVGGVSARDANAWITGQPPFQRES